jgi:Putative adhesin
MTNWIVQEPRTLAFDEDVRELDVRLSAGRVNVVGTDGPARVEIGRVSETPLHVDLTDGVLSVSHEDVRTWPGPLAPLWWWLNGRHRFTADVSIAVPYRTPCVLWLASGSLVASQLAADVKADVISGRLSVLGVDGSLRAKVISGPIEALGCAGEVDVETVSGEIVLADSAASRVRAKTVSGSLIADLDNPPFDSQIKLETVSGEITIRVREDSDLRVSLSAAHGRVTSNFPGMSVEGKWGSSVSGTLGSGNGRLVAGAVGGNISLLRRPVDAAFGVEDES